MMHLAIADLYNLMEKREKQYNLIIIAFSFAFSVSQYIIGNVMHTEDSSCHVLFM